ncbi:hypothetical protein FAM09_00190 [Niastella caeni]|uniref:YbjN domain-containing protein n=1 Tax=Niastella caeni TaxID=2569763 RepID=A0A4S8I096_9BACT|nr:hypothetical protein [Niastella caeni]THU40569.1 hypothetical protein FAM09_00190 [Niastella caeni]
MWNISSLSLVILLVGTVSLSGFNRFQDCNSIDRKQLREILVQLGYETKDLVTDPGKEKYSVTLTRSGLDVPIGVEISGNNKYIWLTVSLGSATAENVTKNFGLLKQNAKTQPCHFYVTESGRLMFGLPLENRGVSNTLLRERLETVATRVGESESLWK